ncbi:MAG: alanine--tRNA ligase [candidate division WS1 bacterium]|nr:alanine--tRNA ligase [candidate division WS1 bacterium]
MTTQELRTSFLDFFRSHHHLQRPSAPLVLANDPTSFFTSAGMQPYMAVFRGEEQPPAPRVVSIQKCVRTGDIEHVGLLNRYHTFFEMLGNFSFGDYFKAGAIDLAWEYVHEVLQLPTEDLWITVFTTDDEAAQLWRERAGIAPERILRFGREDNWWPKLQWEGPCGPCTEIHVDLGPSFGCEGGCGVGCPRCNRYLEVWNVVFQQFTEAPDGALTPLPSPGIDTGMGLERLALVVQQKRYTVETDELFSILTAAQAILNGQRSAPYAYGQDPDSDLALRVITDHLRAAAFLLTDGVTPSNEGPGYVLRRFIRRAYRFGRNLGATGPFLYHALPAVGQAMGQVYPELLPRQEYAQSLLRAEEERFASTLEQGLAIFEQLAEDLSVRRLEEVPGEQAFRLYDTYGFPLDVTRELAAERGLRVDEQGFEAAMEAQRERSRGQAIGLQLHSRASELPASEFVGYDQEAAEAQILLLQHANERAERATPGQDVEIVLDRTPFYAEKGGQVTDHGTLTGPTGTVVIHEVIPVGESYLHKGRVAAGEIRQGDTLSAEIDHERRAAIRRHHTATHLLQAALRQALGAHVNQAGSWVGPDRLRFDFTHHEHVPEEVLTAVERQVNRWIVQDLPVSCTVEPLAQAQAAGVTALFGETYGEEVRVIRAGEVSAELCGGTHTSSTGEIGAFFLLSESSVAAGIRRLEAVTGLAALDEYREQREVLRDLGHDLRCSRDEIVPRVQALRKQVQEAEKRVQEARQSRAAVDVSALAAQAEQVGEISFLAQALPDVDRDLLSQIADQIAAQAGETLILLAGTQDDQAAFVCKVPDALVKQGLKAGDIIKLACTAAGGGGGGRPQFAQGAGKAAQVEEAFTAARRFLSE